MSLKNLSVKIKIPKFLKKKLDNNKINSIYKKFEKSLRIKQNFIVAVSGGPDSLALAFLAKIYSLKNKLDPRFLIVDHKLRKESTKEAKAVKNLLKKHAINLEILTWHGKKPKKNVQSIARKKRYKLLLDKCDQLKINNILLAHHQGDLLENFFIRIVRGSGLKGLISLDKKTTYKNINFLRPLIDQKKKDLLFLSKNVFNFYITDPSNSDKKFKRIQIRKSMIELKKFGLDEKKFLITIKNLKLSNDVVNYYVDKNLRNNTFFSAKKNRLILNNNFFHQPYEVVFRSMSDSIKNIGNKYYPVRGKKLDKIIKEIQNNSVTRVTLGGCIIEKVNQTVIISKEN
jgi:tRNA(Ile)-lysidine synthase